MTTNLRRIERLVQGGQWAESLLAGANVLVEAIQDNIRESLYDTGALHDSVRAEVVDLSRVDIGVYSVYAAVHEYGLRDQRITPRQRAFFWAKYSETGNGMWKALALSPSYTIPARPYVRPAIDTEALAAVKTIGVTFASKIREVVI